MKLLALVSLLIFECNALAVNPDPFNALVWNRDNHLAQNGKVDRADWFEWWYYKVVVPGTDQAFLFYYGIVNPWDVAQSHPGSKSYVGFGSFGDNVLFEEAHPVSEFQASYEKTEIRIGANHATDRAIHGETRDLKTGLRVRWDMTLELDWKFNAMGWSTSVPAISNIYWYPAQASAWMSGKITVGEKTYWLKHAPAYQDRNWGNSLPEWWTWLVSNHFKNSPGTVLAAGGGKPTLLGHAQWIEGLCIGLRHEGQEYTFRTPDNDPMSLDVHWGKWEVDAYNKIGERIQISSYAPAQQFLLLPFTTPAGKVFNDYEALKGSMRVTLSRWQALPFPHWKILADLDSDEAGIEWGTPTPIQ